MTAREPTVDELRAAYLRIDPDGELSSFDEAMADPLACCLIRARASLTILQSEAAARGEPVTNVSTRRQRRPSTRSTLGVDLKRLAAGDNDD